LRPSRQALRINGNAGFGGIAFGGKQANGGNQGTTFNDAQVNGGKGGLSSHTMHYAHIQYNDKTDPEDGLPDEDVNAIDEIPVYSINKPKEESLVILKILSNIKGSQKMMKKNSLLEQLEDAGLIDKNLSSAAKHSRLKGLLNPISVAGGLDNPLVEVEYKGRQSNVILTTQGESTLKIFGE
jgi:hypothetical protein